MRRNIALILAIGLLAAACSGTETSDSTTTTVAPGTTGVVTAVADTFDPSQIRFVAALERFDSCDALLDHFKAEAKERVGPYGLDGGGGGWPVFEETMAFAQDAESMTTMAASTPAPGGGHTTRSRRAASAWAWASRCTRRRPPG